jgi:membrane-bound lytic murein transglycosylase D
MIPDCRTASSAAGRRATAGGTTTLAVIAALLLSACAAQSVRDDEPPASAEDAARQAVLIEPGPPPPDLATPSDAVILERLRKRAAERRAAAARLRLDAGDDRYVDVWARLRSGFRLPRVEHASIDAELRWYAARPDYIQRTTDRARLYLAYIVREAERRGLPLELALLPVVESAFQPYARSPAGAMGLWQFIRSTGRIYGLRQSHWYDGRRDLLASTRAAFDFLQKLHRELDNDWLLAVAAYNTGAGNVRRAMARNRARNRPTDFFSLRLPAETRAYVPRLLAIARLVANPGAYGITLDPIDDDPYFRRVDVGGQISLAKAAGMAGITLDELMLLNSGFMRHATDPAGPHYLLVPAESVPAFRQALAALPPAERMAWSTHSVSRGETLSGIAHRYNVSVDSLRAANEVNGTTLKVGQELRVPVGADQDVLASLSPEVRAGIRRAQRNERRRVHRVRRGDSLWSIARKHRVSVSKLMRWNGLGKRSVIRPGQKIVIWQAGPAPRPATAENPSEYVVRSGDNLWNIARRYKLSTEDLARWNGIEKTAILRPGQKLRLAPPRSAARAPRATDATRRI